MFEIVLLQRNDALRAVTNALAKQGVDPAPFALLNRRQKTRNTSTLESIPGIGPKRRKALLQHLGGLQEVKGASVAELAKVPGISIEMAQTIHDALRG